MSEPSAVRSFDSSPLIERLQHVTEQLAATNHQADVFQIILTPALEVLNAVAGAVLLVDPTAARLEIAATRGHEDRAQTIWQDGPLDGNVPAGAALDLGQPFFFEHQGALVQAFPELEARTGAIAPVASAILPMVLDGQPLGVLILDFQEPHTFTAGERRFLTTLGAQTAIALGRAQLLTQHDTEAARFRRMFEVSPIGMAVGSMDGHLTVANDAYLSLLGYSRQEFDDGQIDWQALTPAEYGAEDRRAFEAAFSQGVSAQYEKEMLTRSGERLPVGVTLIRYDDDQVVGYVQDLRAQKAQQQVLRHERARLEQVTLDQAARLQSEQAASRAFVAFTEAAGQIEDLDQLARLALDTLRTLIPGANVVLTELTPTNWRLRAWTDNLDPDLLNMAQTQGFPLETPVFAELLQTQQPSFTHGWDETVQEVAHTGQYQAVAHYPVMQGDRVVAAIGLAVTDQQCWTEEQQAVIRSIGRSFSLLYDRISTAQQLRDQEAEAMLRTRALQAFSELTTSFDVQLDPKLLIRRAQEIALSLLPPGYAAYFEPHEGQWRAVSQVGSAGLPALQAAIDAGFPVGGTPTLDRAHITGEPYFVEVYDKNTDIAPEVAGHLAAAACLPVYVQGKFEAIFNVPLFQVRQWSMADRAVLVSIVRSLGLALEGSRGVVQLAERSLELTQSNQELHQANAELEAFTYSASHDLRTPVRHVMGFAELAQTSLDKGQYDKTQQHLNVIKQGALRMNSLIDAMLVLSRSGRQELKIQPVDLVTLVRLARQDVGREFTGHPVRWFIGALPVVQGDPGLLQQVMTNLLSNAVKYSAKRPRSEVRVWAQENEHEWRISVQDNGVGFDPQYADRLFGIFQRLHTERDFKGTGVGLATVRRIVLKHGGQVFAQSSDDAGATFGFTLPKT